MHRPCSVVLNNCRDTGNHSISHATLATYSREIHAACTMHSYCGGIVPSDSKSLPTLASTPSVGINQLLHHQHVDSPACSTVYITQWRSSTPCAATWARCTDNAHHNHQANTRQSVHTWSAHDWSVVQVLTRPAVFAIHAGPSTVAHCTQADQPVIPNRSTRRASWLYTGQIYDLHTGPVRLACSFCVGFCTRRVCLPQATMLCRINTAAHCRCYWLSCLADRASDSGWGNVR
jgi:hypothetical protein